MRPSTVDPELEEQNMKKLIAAALLLPSLAISQELTQFENGQVADADVVNQNFQVLKDAIENVDV